MSYTSAAIGGMCSRVREGWISIRFGNSRWMPPRVADCGSRSACLQPSEWRTNTVAVRVTLPVSIAAMWCSLTGLIIHVFMHSRQWASVLSCVFNQLGDLSVLILNNLSWSENRAHKSFQGNKISGLGEFATLETKRAADKLPQSEKSRTLICWV